MTNSNSPKTTRDHTYPNKYNLPTSQLLFEVLDFLLKQQLIGKRPNTVDVAEVFGMTPLDVDRMYDELKQMGEI